MSTYLELIELGAFPNQLDPWAEQGRYFHQLHAQMIGYLIDQLSRELILRGYQIGRETSLQIADNRQPDLFIERSSSKTSQTWDYVQLAEAADLELGLALSSDVPDLDALYIRDIKTSQLVTVLEIVSPSNKVDLQEIEQYKTRRKRLLEDEVHVVEIDFTRSIKRFIDDQVVDLYPYHIAIHLVGQLPRFIGMQLGDAPKTFALPLNGEVIALELNPVYRQAYARLTIGLQIHNRGDYTLENLPFPSLIEESERRRLLQEVQTWQVALRAAYEQF